MFPKPNYEKVAVQSELLNSRFCSVRTHLTACLNFHIDHSRTVLGHRLLLPNTERVKVTASKITAYSLYHQVTSTAR